MLSGKNIRKKKNEEINKYLKPMTLLMIGWSDKLEL